MKNTKLYNLRFLLAGIALSVFALAVCFNFNTVLYQANILKYAEHPAFDGTVYPIQKVPNWTKMDASKRTAHYSEFTEKELIQIPYYDPSALAFPAADLVWGNKAHDDIRNAKITYSVPYMGNYRLDGKEYAGSHAAVDIKVPSGTPVFAIANGVVVKVSRISSGFGHHVVVMHRNVPTLDDSARTTLYSSYSHLSDIFIADGDVVLKGDKIALTGATGTVTTPHLHFQIDNEKSPWWPFWPFTWQDVQDAGLDFFSAVNEGLGAEKAALVTVHPLQYVQKYLDGSFEGISYADDLPVVDDPTKGPDAVSYVDNNIVDTVAERAPEAISYVDPDKEIKVAGENGGENVLELDTTGSSRFSDVDSGSQYYDAVTFLTERKIIQGYKDGTFRPDRFVNRVEALKFILEGIEATLESGGTSFSDISGENWFDEYLYTAYRLNIVEGHPDGTFKPNNPVNKAEFFKILFNGMKVDIDPEVLVVPYEDVAIDSWFSHYIAYAKELGILDSSQTKINPSQSMTRGEVANAMYRLMMLVD
jgi:murein DD-endopeptidase MepM/ murein hydrolase activator NlpD